MTDNGLIEACKLILKMHNHQKYNYKVPLLSVILMCLGEEFSTEIRGLMKVWKPVVGTNLKVTMSPQLQEIVNGLKKMTIARQTELEYTAKPKKRY